MNPQPKLYHLIDIEGEKKLRHVNPFQAPSIYACRTDEEIENYNQFEQSAIANAKVLINPVDGKTEYAGEGLREVWQWYDKYEFEWRNNLHGDFIDYSYFSIFYKRNIESCSDTRQAFEYIGEKVEEIEISEIQQVKNDNYLLTIKVDQLERELKAERSRIIGLIESVMKKADMIGYLTLNELLTLMKQDGKQQ